MFLVGFKIRSWVGWHKIIQNCG